MARQATEQNVAAKALPAWKRALDVAAIAALSPGLALVSGGIALLIKAGSPGPVLFKQRRVGLRGEHFTLYKFRTMKPNVETDSHRQHTQELIDSDVPMVKLDAANDPRLIPMGAILRSTGLDELPQLINVLRGEMSIVGPRPCIPYELDRYKPWHHRRLEAVPGLTGLWQVSGKNRTTFDEMVRFDIRYAQKRSLFLDLKIILKTLPAIWTQVLETRAMRRQAQRAPAQRFSNQPSTQTQNEFST